MGEVSAEGDEISGNASDEHEQVGFFSFKKVKTEQES